MILINSTDTKTTTNYKIIKKTIRKAIISSIIIFSIIFLLFLQNKKKDAQNLSLDSSYKFDDHARTLNLLEDMSKLNFSTPTHDFFREDIIDKGQSDFGLYSENKKSLSLSQEVDPYSIINSVGYSLAIEDSLANFRDWYRSFEYCRKEILLIAGGIMHKECLLDNENNNLHTKMNNLIKKNFGEINDENYKKILSNNLIKNYNKFALGLPDRNKKNFCLLFIKDFAEIIECARIASLSLCCIESIDLKNKDIVMRVCIDMDTNTFFPKFLIFKHFSAIVHIKYVNFIIVRIKLLSHLLNTSFISSFTKQVIQLLFNSQLTIIQKCKEEKEMLDRNIHIDFLKLLLTMLPKNFIEVK